MRRSSRRSLADGSELNDYNLNAALRASLRESKQAQRRALEGELAALESAWREAEEIAAIADALLVPPVVQEKLARYRQPTG